ncbi:type II toxin-antitoxin system VapC family toxin [Phenylobacterium sp.]|uniref:type II toxin-antitoxin system VapC family toxin n=1 Tax=Phenylobacterium sp. TaxID=1871053 RepID=UPI0025DA8393|nr:type II toxin-antitoxin system VapC family toxin [Phenylobacterium sp.]
MRLLLDTHLLVWAAGAPHRLSRVARDMIEDPKNTLVFSVVSVWEVAIKHGLGRPEFRTEPRVFRQRLMMNGFQELLITSEHVVGVATLPTIHRDPFDRLLIAQAIAEDLLFVSGDRQIGGYPGPIRRV